MTHDDSVAAARWRARWMKPNAHLWLHPDRTYWGLPPTDAPRETKSVRQNAEVEAAARILDAQADREFEREMLDLRVSLARLRTEGTWRRIYRWRRRQLV